MEFIYEPEFWVAVSFFIFIGVLVYLGVHKKVANELDARALRISKELEEVRRLGKRRKSCSPKPAQARRRRHGGGNMIALAARQAETCCGDTPVTEGTCRTRIKLAEKKIARAEMKRCASYGTMQSM